MATEDKAVHRIPAEGLPPHGMSVSRFNEYMALFRELDVRGGMDWGIPPSPNGLFVIANSTVPIGGKYQMVGYAYLTTPPVSVENHLPSPEFAVEIHAGRGRRLHFSKLGDNWYLFYASEW